MIVLYDSNNDKHYLSIGAAQVNGRYPVDVRNMYNVLSTGTISLPQTVEEETVPSGNRYVEWSYNANPAEVTTVGTSLYTLTGNTYYTKPDGGGTVITLTRNADDYITDITFTSGNLVLYYTTQGGKFIDVYFCRAVDSFGLNNYEGLTLWGVFDDGGTEASGFQFGGHASLLEYCFYDSLSDSLQTRYDSETLMLPDAGDKGFRPRGELTKHTLGGGSITGQGVGYDTDALTQPGAPDESSASIVGGAGFINIYKISETNLAKLGHCLFSDTIMTAFQALLVNPMDSVISLNIFPCSPDVGGSEPINLFRWACAASGTFALGTLAQGHRLAKQFKVYDFGTLSVAEMWESFLDYDATSFELYLPFIGAVDIPVGEVMNGFINVQYTVDFVSGMCVANVLCRKTATLSSGKVATQYAQHSYTGNCAMNVPLSAINYGNMIGSFVSAAASGLRAPMSIVTSALEGKMQPTIETKGTVGGNAGFCSVLYPYITVTRPITAEPDSYQEVMGYPSYINTSLGECSDLCVCDEINLTGLSGATDGEIERIRQICKEGIFV